jgi:two-component system response regulator FlrC
MSQHKVCIALLDSQPSAKSNLASILSDERIKTLALDDVRALHEAASQETIDMVMLHLGDDARFMEAVVHQMQLTLLDCPVIAVVGQGEVQAAIDAMRMGARHVLPLPIQIDALEDALNDVFAVNDNSGFTCEAEQSRQLLALADRVAQTDVTVLINGESGTGKEVLAQHVHAHSPRAGKPFIAVNCASIPESMLEDMLFGHEKGAFTGAHQRHEGLFEQAHRGTIFLDEIGEMPLVLQAKILRVLQERELRRLGGSEIIKLDVRVVTATNRDLAERVADKEFREDLYYRLNVFPLKIAPLREREEDIMPIAKALLKKHQGVVGRRCKLSKATEQFLKAYPWPGNVRELENVIQRAMVLAFDGKIEIEHLLLEQAKPVLNKPSLTPESPSVNTSPYIEKVIHAEEAPAPVAEAADDAGLSDLTWKSESRVILDTLTRFSGNRKNTAEKLGISPRTLRYKLAKLKEEGVAIP